MDDLVGFGAISRRQAIHQAMLAATGVTLASGCVGSPSSASRPERVWGRFGYSDGRFNKPRAITIDAKDQLYIVDMTARIQVFDLDGNFLRTWQTPASENGRPTGLSVDRQGRICVADTHYFRVLFYEPDGTLLSDKTIGGTSGSGPGEFNFVTDVVDDSAGNYYIAEYGEYDRIQKFSPTGEFLMQWGSHGDGPQQFMRPQSLAIDELDHLWVADACNHRIQVFQITDDRAELLNTWGQQGSEPGMLNYPYGIVLDLQGNVLVCEFGNDRVQRFTRNGRSLGTWGRNGRGPGQLHQPWSAVQDSLGRIHVLDSYNHRVQRFVL